MKVLTILASVLVAAATGQNMQFSLNVPGIDAWRLALDQHAAAEGRLTGFVQPPGVPHHLGQHFSPQPLPPVQHPPQVPVPTHLSNGNFQGIPQWKLHQEAVLTAEKQLETIQTTPKPAKPSPRPFPVNNVLQNTKVVENFIAQIKTDSTGGKTSEIAKLLDEVKNRSKAAAAAGAVAPSPPSKSSGNSVEQVIRKAVRGSDGRPPSFLDNLLSTLIKAPASGSNEVTSNQIDDDVSLEESEEEETGNDAKDGNDSLSEILALLGVKEKKKEPKEDDDLTGFLKFLAVPSRPSQKKEEIEEPALSSLADILNIQPAKKPKKSILRPSSEDELLAESLARDLLGLGPEGASGHNNIALVNEIDEFLAILDQIDPSLGGPKEQIRSSGPSAPSLLSSPPKRPRVSNFIQEELTEAAEESVLLSSELDELLKELEVEKQKDLKFIDETYDIINAKLRRGTDLKTILKDDDFVDSVFHRFAILGFPLRKEDLSIKDLMEAKKLVTENIIAAAEQNKRIALGLIQDLDVKSREARR